MAAEQAGQDNSGVARSPVLLVVDADRQARAITVSALVRRFGADFHVLAADSAEAGLRQLQHLAEGAAQVALVAADLRLPGMGGVDFLERARTLHRGAFRALLMPMGRFHTRIPFEDLATLQRATVMGRIDFWVMKGWATPEEWLYPQVQDALRAWTMSHGTRHLVYRVVGEQWEPRCHEIRDVLTRNSVPFEFHPTNSETGQRLIREHGIDVDRLPALISHDGSVMHNPTYSDVAVRHGIQISPARDAYDLVILGAGPAGLAAAVYGPSEGLQTLVLESVAIGGQAGTSPMIRNYLGFPRGTTGGDLAHHAWEQAVLLGAEFVFTRRVTGLAARGTQHLLELADGRRVSGRAVLIATGVSYRRLEIPALDRLIGMGVFYGAAGVEAPAVAGEDVYVVGGANSAGQAALHLAKFAAHVTLLVRGPALAAGMSDYLVRQILAAPCIDVQLETRVIDATGSTRLETLTLEDMRTGHRQVVSTAAVFVLIGARPHTEWLKDALQLDEHGFVLTGRDVPGDLWHLNRAPLPFETSLPGVFAAGDVRHGSVKRVAGAVGEGSVAVGSVHQYLAEPLIATTPGETATTAP